MTMWSETRKAMFKWNQYVRIYIDGEQVTDAVQVRDTEQYGGYIVDEMFGYNKVTNVMLVTPDFDPLADDGDDAEWEEEQAERIKNELEHEIRTIKERIERKERLGYFDGKRGMAMRRHYERKLANAEALYGELFGDGEPEDEIAQAAQVVKGAGGMAVLPENRERFDAQLKQLHNAEGACDKALAKVNKLTDAIEDMKYDCDAEVYDKLLEIADILGR